jgi:hypothetical protein
MRSTSRACGIAPDGTRIGVEFSEKVSTSEEVDVKHPEMIDVRAINTADAIA